MPGERRRQVYVAPHGDQCILPETLARLIARRRFAEEMWMPSDVYRSGYISTFNPRLSVHKSNAVRHSDNGSLLEIMSLKDMRP